MRSRVRDGYTAPYNGLVHKRQTARVVGGVVQLRGSFGANAGGGGGGGGGGGDTSASAVKKRTPCHGTSPFLSWCLGDLGCLS